MIATHVRGGAEVVEAATQAARRSDWPSAAAAAEGLLDLLVRSFGDRDSDRVRAIGASASKLGLEITLANDLPARPTPLGVAMLLRAVAGAAAIADRGTARAEDGDTRGLILETLVLAAGAPKANVELAQRCRRSEETIARVLKSMRAQGLVISRRAGRIKQNWITEEGRQVYEGGGTLRDWLFDLTAHPLPADEANSVKDILIAERACDPPAGANTVHEIMALAS